MAVPGILLVHQVPVPVKRHLLLMTATITPDNAVELVRTDPAVRLEDYRRALDYSLGFIDRPLDGIIFVENSDSDVSSLRKLVASRGMRDRVEFVSNYGVHSYPEKGRAYGEFKLLDHAMAASTFVKDGGAAAVAWKITGRYIVKNLPAVIERAPATFDLYVDMKDRPMRWMDMRLMAWSVQGYERLLRGLADTLDAQLNERIMRDYLPKCAAEHGGGLRVVARFRNEPLVDGIRGYDNQNYSKGKNLAKFYVRSVGRRVVPWLWI